MGKPEAYSPRKPGLVELPGAGVMTVAGSHILLLSGGKLWRIGEEGREIVGQVTLPQPTHLSLRGSKLLIQSNRSKKQESRPLEQPDRVLETSDLKPSRLRAGDREVFKCREECLWSVDQERGESVEGLL